MGLAEINLASTSVEVIRYYINSPTYTKNIGTYEWYSAKQSVYASKSYSSASPYCIPWEKETYKHYYVTGITGTTQFSTTDELAAGRDLGNNWTASITNSSMADGKFLSLTKTPTTTYLQRTAYTLELGDVFYSDGAISKPGLSKLYPGKTPIGVVAFIPTNDTEKAWVEPTHNGGRALVMALKNSAENEVLYDNTVANGYPAYSGKYKTGASGAIAYSDWSNDKSGYTDTHTYLSTTGSPAGYYALNHSPAGPSTSSGWFLPTAGQWIYVLASRAGITPNSVSIQSSTYDTTSKAFNTLNSYLINSGAAYSALSKTLYWTNTNYLSGSTTGVWVLNFGNGFSIGGESNKADNDYLNYVRPFLAF